MDRKQMGNLDELIASVTQGWTDEDWLAARAAKVAMQMESEMIALAHFMVTQRKVLGISQRELARLSGIQQAEISKLEKRKGNPTLLTQIKLRDALGGSIAPKMFFARAN